MPSAGPGVLEKSRDGPQKDSRGCSFDNMASQSLSRSLKRKGSGCPPSIRSSSFHKTLKASERLGAGLSSSCATTSCRGPGADPKMLRASGPERWSQERQCHGRVRCDADADAGLWCARLSRSRPCAVNLFGVTFQIGCLQHGFPKPPREAEREEREAQLFWSSALEEIPPPVRGAPRAHAGGAGAAGGEGRCGLPSTVFDVAAGRQGEPCPGPEGSEPRKIRGTWVLQSLRIAGCDLKEARSQGQRQKTARAACFGAGIVTRDPCQT